MGQRQRAAIAGEIILSPQIILADKQAGALDSETSAGITELLKEFNVNNDITLVVITYDDAIADCCERKIIIKDRGRLHNGLSVMSGFDTAAFKKIY